jgi:hypothetical protein
VKLPGKLLPKRPPLRCGEDSADCLLAVRDGDNAPKLAALRAKAGVPDQIISAGRQTIVAGAMPHDPVQVDTVSVGQLGRQGDGLVAPLFVRIVYARQGGYEVREANVKCRLDASGTVSSLA